MGNCRAEEPMVTCYQEKCSGTSVPEGSSDMGVVLAVIAMCTMALLLVAVVVLRQVHTQSVGR